MIELFGKKYITEKEASVRYQYSREWFRRRRWQRAEPKYIKPAGKGKVYYPLEDTDSFFKKWFELKQ